MGKAKKAKPSRKQNKVPLDQEIEDAKFAKPKSRNKVRPRQDDEEQVSSSFKPTKQRSSNRVLQFVGASLSRKILSTAREQQRELENEYPTLEDAVRKPKMTKLDAEGSDSDSDDEQEDNLTPDTFYENIEVDEEDEQAMERFMSSNPLPRRTLADIIMDKITEKHTELETRFSDAGTIHMQDLDPRVKQMYEGVRDVLRKYRSGKLPKAFKIIPSLRNWEQILYITDPPTWSAAAMYQATRIFASNLKEKMAQRFYNLVLLPRIRDDLAEYKRLNFHLYQALRKALFKPGGFMKGAC